MIIYFTISLSLHACIAVVRSPLTLIEIHAVKYFTLFPSFFDLLLFLLFKRKIKKLNYYTPARLAGEERYRRKIQATSRAFLFDNFSIIYFRCCYEEPFFFSLSTTFFIYNIKICFADLL